MRREERTMVKGKSSTGRSLVVTALALAAFALSSVPASHAQSEDNSLQFDLIAIQSLLPLVAETFGVNLVQSGAVPGSVSLSIEGLSLRRTLDEVLLGTGYTYHLSNGVLRIIPSTTVLSLTLPLNHLAAVETKEILTDIIGEAQLAAEPISNSITAVGPAADLRRIEDAVLHYDIPPRQVQIFSRMIEINITEHEALGIDWSSSWDDQVQSATGRTNVNVDPSPDFSINYSRLSDWELNAVLNAIETTTDARIISRPVLVMANQVTSKILVGERVPYTRFVNETDSGNTLEEVDFIDVGIQLEVTPIIASDSMIIMQIDAELSQVLDKEVQGVPRIGSREAHTRVAVKSGETAVIGGLRKEEMTTTVRGVPFLSSIPFLGRFFRSEDDLILQSELVIFMTPTLVDIGTVPDEFETAGTP